MTPLSILAFVQEPSHQEDTRIGWGFFFYFVQELQASRTIDGVNPAIYASIPESHG